MSARILLFTNTYDTRSDLMGVVPAWVAALRAAGAQVIVVTQHAGEDRDGVIEVSKRTHASSVVRLLMVLRTVVRMRSSYDVLFVAMAPTWAMLLAPLVRLMGKRAFLWYAVWKSSWRLRIAEKAVSGILCSVPESFPFKSSKVRAVGQAIDTARFAPEGAHRPVGHILCLGRISPVKHIELLFRAVTLLPDLPDARSIHIAGAPVSQRDHAYEQELRNQMRKSDLSDAVVWLGKVGHHATHELFRRADIVVNMTPAGSFDKTILEAMSCGALVVASNPALRRFLAPAIADRLLFRQGDAADMARVLADVMAMSDADKDELRAACRDMVRTHHSVTQWSERVLEAMA